VLLETADFKYLKDTSRLVLRRRRRKVLNVYYISNNHEKNISWIASESTHTKGISRT
jgi:hypothetical protein